MFGTLLEFVPMYIIRIMVTRKRRINRKERAAQDAFIAKIGIAIEEADETLYWLEMIAEAQLLPEHRLTDLMREGNEIVAILTASSQTAKRNLK